MKIFLIENKIYFETIFAVILSLASIITTVTACSIQRAQKIVEEKNARPVIDIATEYDKEGFVSSVSVVNTGGLLGTLNVEIYPFLYYSVLEGEAEENNIDLGEDPSYGYRVHKAILPLYIPTVETNLYTTYRPHTKSDVLFEIKESNLTSEFAMILDSLPKVVKEIDSKAYRVDYVSMQYFLQVEYTDLVDGSKVMEAYCIDTGRNNLLGSIYYAHDIGVNRISEGSETERLFELLKSEKNQSHYAFVVEGETYQEKAESMINTAIDWYIRGEYRME